MPLKLLAAIAVSASLFIQPVSGQQADTYHATNGLQVVGTAGEFEVLTTAGSGVSDYFCAAGEFAGRVLGARNTNQLLVVSVRGPSVFRENRRAVVYRVTPPGRSSGIVEMIAGPRVGQTTTVGHANVLCQ